MGFDTSPLIVLLMILYRKRVFTAASSVFTAYLCCQPSKWFALLTDALTDSVIMHYTVRITVLIIVGVLALKYFSPYLSKIFNKDNRSVIIFGITPAVYYFYDYGISVYHDVLNFTDPLVSEFMPFFLSVVFIIFCIVYYKEYELKADALRKEQIINISVKQQEKELNALKHREQDIRILKHDMRHLLNYISDCLDNDDIVSARKLIDGYISNVNETDLKTYCDNQTINYTLSHYHDICRDNNIEFITEVKISDILVDETIFFSILSNALDNAVKAQSKLPKYDRRIYILLKESGNKLLLMVKNPYAEIPFFVDGLPVSDKKNHGYGTQSILHMTEVLGGKCLFSTENNEFIVRVII